MDKQMLSTNIYNEEESKQLIGDVLETVSNAIAKSLGPYGSTTIIRDPHNVEHTITKDGYSILKRIEFENDIQSIINGLIKKVSFSLVSSVGDGSTSSVIVANELYKKLNDFFSNNNIPRKDVLDFLDIFENEITKYILKYSKRIESKEDLVKVASISNNNDEHMGELVADIYDQLDYQGFINLEKSTSELTHYKFITGIETHTGYINFVYTTEKDKRTCMFEEPRYLLCNDYLTDEDSLFLAEMLSLSMATEYPLVILARGFSSEIENLFNNNKARFTDKLMISPVPIMMDNNNRYEQFLDLAVYLNADIYDKYSGVRLTEKEAGEFFMQKTGRSKKCVITENNCQIIEGYFKQEEINDRINVIKAEKEKILEKSAMKDVSDEVYELDKRIERIKGKIATLYVGGKSDMEKSTRKDLAEDSILACRSAIKNGYILGGNLMIPYLINKFRNKLINTFVSDKSLFIGFNKKEKEECIIKLIKVIEESFKISFETVIRNKFNDDNRIEFIMDKCLNNKSLKIYNLKLDKYETIKNSKVINSVETDIEIMKSVFSIIGLLSSSNQLLDTNCRYKY